MDHEKLKTMQCPIEVSMALIGGKYKLMILFELTDETLRYSELQRRIPQATPRMLSRQLKELAEDGLIQRTLYPVVPPRTEYALTDLGRTLIPLLNNLCDWGSAYIKILNIENPFLS